MTPEWADLLCFNVDVAEQVCSIEIVEDPIRRARERGSAEFPDPHWEMFKLLSHVRLDNGIRVVVISGETDGKFMRVEPFAKGDADPTLIYKMMDADAHWTASAGIVHMHKAMAELDRPIIAKVNGDALGLGASFVFAADLIVAAEDARIADNHMGAGEVQPALLAHSVVPGDGGAALMPLHLSPALAKEYLMLAREYSGRELAEMGVINYAVPMDRLDSLVDSLTTRLLKRNAHALAWTKRVANKHIVDQLNRTLDAGVGYELLNFYQLSAEGEERFILKRPVADPGRLMTSRGRDAEVGAGSAGAAS
ncbi:MAG TPA: enoyl-CoA hydratase/isomerase family protein [Gaiellaceae bacterium]|nr:enoyl-CoA hydratase/isomerase family protein [Gaiellaceae bacterium]